jgi:Holliday junction DNA helicase RuvA
VIAKLKGVLDEKSPGEVVVDIGGVGYHAAVSVTTFCRLPDEGKPVDLFTVTNLRDNALELFAFHDRRERTLFNLLRTVSGIGPRLALAVLSGLEPDALANAVGSGAVDRLVAIPGVGRKTAERIVVELKDRVEMDPSGDDSGASSTQIENDAVLALVALGYKEPQARKAVSASAEVAGDSIETLIKTSLVRLT